MRKARKQMLLSSLRELHRMITLPEQEISAKLVNASNRNMAWQL